MVKVKGKTEIIIKDCDDLEEICMEIYSHTADVYDFLFPQYPTPLKHHEALEKIILMFKLYLNLVLQFLGLTPQICLRFPKHRSVMGAELSVPALAYSVWSRIKSLALDAIAKEGTSVKTGEEGEERSQGSQTQLTSLRDCENCEISKDIVRKMIAKVEALCSKNKIPSFVAIIRQQLRPRMHEISAWAAMTFWHDAIMFDMDALSAVEKKEKKKASVGKKQLMETIRSLEAQLGYGPATLQGQEIVKLKKKVLRLKMELVKKTEETKNLSNKLDSTETALQKANEEIQELKLKLQREQESAKHLEKKIEEKIQDVNVMVAKYEKEIDDCKRKMKFLELEKDSKQLQINEQMVSIGLLEKKVEESLDKEMSLTEKLGLMQKELDSFPALNEEYLKLQAQLKEKSSTERKLLKKTKHLEKELNSGKKSEEKLAKSEEPTNTFPIKLTGDVKIDIAMQKVANEQKIKLLKSKNKKLQSVLERICNENIDSAEGKLKSEGIKVEVNKKNGFIT